MERSLKEPVMIGPILRPRSLRSRSRRKTKTQNHGTAQPKRKVVNRLVERRLIHRVSHDTYRSTVQKVYGGRRGAMLDKFSRISGHLPLGERLLRDHRFDLRGDRDILDVGSGIGQILGHMTKYADPEAHLTGIDVSHAMLERAQNRLQNTRPRLVTADLAKLPFADGAFDCVTCGYVLEHLPDGRSGLAELYRVMRPGGHLLLLVTEDNFGGAWTSRFWTCRTYNRHELFQLCEEVGFEVHQELWFSRMHKLVRAGGICVEVRKPLA